MATSIRSLAKKALTHYGMSVLAILFAVVMIVLSIFDDDDDISSGTKVSERITLEDIGSMAYCVVVAGFGTAILFSPIWGLILLSR